MHKYRNWIVCGACASLLFAGCSKNDSLKKASNDFFEAFNRICEADTLQASGSADLLDIKADFTLGIDSALQQAALCGSTQDGKQIAFYLKDGKTYLNALGVKSSSLAANIGIEKGDGLHLPNPFLELDADERMRLFDSVRTEGDEYIFQVNKSSLEQFLDDYGAVSVSQASLETVIHDGKMASLDFEMEGVYDISVQSAPLNASLILEIESIDEPVTLSFPSDLGTWPAQ